MPQQPRRSGSFRLSSYGLYFSSSTIFSSLVQREQFLRILGERNAEENSSLAVENKICRMAGKISKELLHTDDSSWCKVLERDGAPHG
ncbi:hypothetical protein CEXT_68421 [Caerostris extrusa]|uniref:Uncharacterized protein n=1 Tax=Caerostris extrusa TaxID=172846 RepID=A0AAV4MN81_CAEEX|nr:hypothetical protein CEXT_68421 [Caerostris extrusa]